MYCDYTALGCVIPDSGYSAVVASSRNLGPDFLSIPYPEENTVNPNNTKKQYSVTQVVWHKVLLT